MSPLQKEKTMELLESITNIVMSISITLLIIVFVAISIVGSYNYCGIPGLIFAIGFWVLMIHILGAIHRSNTRTIKKMRSTTTNYWTLAQKGKKGENSGNC